MALEAESADPSTTILLIHVPSLDPRPFLTSLIAAGEALDEDADIVPWHIDNKYYTANVTFQLVPLGSADSPPSSAGVPIVIYLFTLAIGGSLPSGLTKLLLDEPRDISLAVRVPPPTETANDGEGITEWDAMQESLEELGLEVVDLTGSQADEDDERPIDPHEQIRQTLMTHMWPNMVRKPSASSRAVNMSPPSSFPDNENKRSSIASSSEDDLPPAVFPTTFTSTSTTTIAIEEGGAVAAFPSVEDLRAQILFAEMEAGPSRLRQRMLEDDDDDEGFWDDEGEDGGEKGWGGAGMDEYAKLDEWLDGDEGEFDEIAGEGEGEGVDAGTDEEDSRPDSSHRDDSNQGESGGEGREEREEQARSVPPQFEDDFEDFAPFVSAPAPAPRQLRGGGGGGAGAGLTTLDPTPLLLHLQAVRAELAGVADEDERRTRAGKEVERVMRDLGMGGGFAELDEDDEADEGGLDGLLGGPSNFKMT